MAIVRTERVFTPTKQHIALCKKVLKIIAEWKPYMIFTWEWDGTVIPIDVIQVDGQEADMCIMQYDYLRQSDISVAESALHLSPDELELTVLHELGHMFIRDLYIAHLQEVASNNPSSQGSHQDFYDFTAWGHAEELTCWRFAKMLQATKKGKNNA